MDLEKLQTKWETLESEHLKSLAEFGLHIAPEHALGRLALQLARGGERIEDSRLYVEMAGLHFGNPVMVGAGWDKRGRAVDGLYLLGFSGTEVGSVLVHPQKGNPRPRLFIDKQTKSVGLNRLGFNSIGMEAMANNLTAQERRGIVGISLGKNKLTPDEQAPWAHAAVAERLHEFADYFVINVASPNTPGLRNLLSAEPLTNIIRAVNEVIARKGAKPLFVKTTIDLALEDLNVVLQVCIDEGVTGVIDTNTTIEQLIKAKYGWKNEMGGLSGNDNEFRNKANDRMKHITRETRGTGLQRIGVGGINNAYSAIERMKSGAQVVQVVTGIRQRKGRIARDINLGILESIEKDKFSSVEEYIGMGVAA